MSNPSLDQLLAWMNNKSHTWGWGAMVAYDRRKANELLHQLYVERFDSDSYLPLVNATMSSSDYHKQHLSNLKFAAPRLSFVNADLNDSKVSLTLDFIGGLIVTESQGVGISKVQKVLPLNSPHLSMIQPLKRVPGEIDSDGVVSLNLANEEGTDFKANFVLADLDQERLGEQFRLFFEDQVPDEAKVFYLGTLTGEANEALTPSGFKIFTMAAPGARVRGAENYGDGAVLVFVRLNSPNEGKNPGADFMYPIPADADGTVYTGCVWVSSRTLVDELVRESALKGIAYDIQFAPYSGSGDQACTLAAESGSMLLEEMSIWREMGIDESSSITATYDYRFADVAGPFSITPVNGRLDARWETEFSTAYDFKRIKNGWNDQEKTGTMQCWSQAGFAADVSMDEQGEVHFTSHGHWVEVQFKADQELDGFTHDDHNGDPFYTRYLRDKLEPSFREFLGSFSLPTVNTFLIQNLLFPGQNALHLTDVHMPGDLALFGHIDPLRTAVVISPRQATVAAGGTQSFSLGPTVSGVVWTLRGTDPDDEDAGSISTAGVYTAPARDKLPKGYLAAVLTGRGTLEGGVEVQSSALITVLTSTVALNPLFQVCGEGESVELSAEMMEGQPDWWLKDTSLGGKLSTNKGNTCTYTAPELNSSREPIYIDTVLAGRADGTYAESMVMVLNRSSNLNVVISKDSDPASGTVQLQVVLNGVPENPDVKGIECRLLAGGGTLTQDGVYKQAPGATGCAVVAMVIDDGWDLFAGYIAMPLPLTTYGEINQRVSRSISEHSVHPGPSGPAR